MQRRSVPVLTMDTWRATVPGRSGETMILDTRYSILDGRYEGTGLMGSRSAESAGQKVGDLIAPGSQSGSPLLPWVRQTCSPPAGLTAGRPPASRPGSHSWEAPRPRAPECTVMAMSRGGPDIPAEGPPRRSLVAWTARTGQFSRSVEWSLDSNPGTPHIFPPRGEGGQVVAVEPVRSLTLTTPLQWLDFACFLMVQTFTVPA